MERVNKIIFNPNYERYLLKNMELEKQRIFCKHDLEHFLDTARIMYIISLEKNLNFNKEVIYACALLHDIGRWKQYEEHIPHNIASAELATDILKHADYTEKEINDITDAIKNHRKALEEENSLSFLLYSSDKLSRRCFNCPSHEQCNWSDEKKNLKIKY